MDPMERDIKEKLEYIDTLHGAEERKNFLNGNCWDFLFGFLMMRRGCYAV